MIYECAVCVCCRTCTSAGCNCIDNACTCMRFEPVQRCHQIWQCWRLDSMIAPPYSILTDHSRLAVKLWLFSILMKRAWRSIARARPTRRHKLLWQSIEMNACELGEPEQSYMQFCDAESRDLAETKISTLTIIRWLTRWVYVAKVDFHVALV